MNPTKTKLQILSLEWKDEVQGSVLPSVFIKVLWMLEKVIHKIYSESLQDGMNKRKTASVFTPALATLRVKSFGLIPNSGEKQ